MRARAAERNTREDGTATGPPPEKKNVDRDHDRNRRLSFLRLTVPSVSVSVSVRPAAGAPSARGIPAVPADRAARARTGLLPAPEGIHENPFRVAAGEDRLERPD